MAQRKWVAAQDASYRAALPNAGRKVYKVFPAEASFQNVLVFIRRDKWTVVLRG